MTIAERRVLTAAERRLRDSRGRPIRMSTAGLAAEENLNCRQVRRILRRLEGVGIIEITYAGTARGLVVVGPPPGSKGVAA